MRAENQICSKRVLKGNEDTSLIFRLQIQIYA